MKILTLILLLYATFSNFTAVFANGATETYNQETLTTSKLNKTQWQKAVEGLNYTPIPKPKVTSNKNNINLPRINIRPLNFSESWGRFLLIGLLVLFIGFVLFRVMVNINDAPLPIRQQIVTIEDIEKNIHEADIDKFLREALAANNYRLAVRLYYLAIIKELSLKGKINWQRDKTNGAYLREMRNNSQLYTTFANITLIFEYVWYSNSNFSKENYEQVSPQFISFLPQI
jgi:hypothetical protein